MATTWNPADNTATLSNGNNTSAGSSGVGSRGTNSISGKNRVEFVAGASDNSGDYGFGIGNAAANLGDATGGSSYIIVAVAGTVYVLENGATPLASYSGTITSGDIFDVDIDLPSLKLYVSQNNVKKVGDVDAGTGGATIASGTYFPFVSFIGAARSVTLDADTPTYAPPSGYTIIGGGGGGSTYTLTADRGIYTQTGVAADFPNLVSKAAYKGAANGSTTATIPSHVSGDLLIAFAFRDGSTTQPTLPAGWTSITTRAGTTCCGRWAWKRAASSSETSGTWTNATELEIAVYSGVDRVGASASQDGTAASVTYPALTMQFGNSWVSASAGHRSINTTLETPPTGMTLRDNRLDATAESAIFDTNGLVTSFTSRSVSVGGTASGWVAGSVELVPQWGGAAGAASYTLVADRGTFTYSGVAAGLRTARKLVSALGTYALTGQAAGLKRGLRVVSNQGSYSLTGNAAGLVAARKLAASQGSYSLTGIAATLTYTPAAAAYTLTADASSCALTGRAAGLIAKRFLVASTGGYVLTGRSAGFNGQRLLSAAAGSHSVTGRAATLSYTPAVANYVLTAEAGGYAVTGRDAAFNIAGQSAVTASGAPRKPLILPYRKQEPKTRPPAQPEISASPDKADVALSAIAERIDAVLAKSGDLKAQTDTAIAAATEQAMLAAQEAQKLARQDEEDALIALLLAA